MDGMRQGTKRRWKTSHLMQIASIVTVVALGITIVSAKLGAQGALAAPKAPPSAMPTAATPDVPPGASAGAPMVGAEKGEGAPPTESDEPTNVTMDGTVVQTEEDFPKEMSDEQREAMGTGKVPIHREGRFRSPLANPKFGGPAKVKVGLVVSEVRDYEIRTGGFASDFFLSF